MSLTLKAKMFGYGATAGYLFYLGVFTIVGALIMLCPIGWAFTAVFFAVIIEGTVYAKNIFKGIENSNTEFALKHALAVEKLKQLEKNHPDNLFIQTYFNKKKYLHDLHESNQHNAFTEAEIEDTTKFLTHLEAVFIECLENPTITSKNLTKQKIINHIISCINTTDKENFNATISHRSPYMLLSKFISFFSGLFSATSAAAVLYGKLISLAGTAFLTHIGLSVAIATGVIVPLMAIMVLIGSGLVMYGTASESIKKGGLDGWLVKIDEFLDLKKSCNGCWKFFKKCIFYLFVGSLIILSTAATIYSFFAPIISPPVKLLLVTSLTILIGILALISFSLTLIFNTENALTSLSKIKEAVKDSWQNTQDNWRNSTSLFDFITQFDTFKKDTTWPQIFNPFRLARNFILAAHAYCIGISADNFPYIPPFIVSLISAAMEWLTDFHYVNSNKRKEHSHNKIEDISNGHNLESKEKKESQHTLENHQSHETNKKAEDEDDHDHDHGSPVELVMMLFNGFAVIWDYFAGKGNESLQNSKDKFFPPAKALPSPPSVPLEFTQYHLNVELDEQIIKYRKQAANESGMDSLPAKKASAFRQLKKTINANLQKKEFSSCIEREHKQYEKYESSDLPLTQHQNSVRFFKSTPPTSFQTAQTILGAAKRSLAAAPS